MKYPNTNKTLTYVNHPVMKKDAMALVTGKPVYTDDIAPGDCLCVKLLRSPHAHAMIREIHTETAMKVPGIVCILTYKDVPHRRFTMAGQTYPEESPYDRYILDAHVRFCGDPVAIIAGENEQAVDRAKKLIKVTYDVLEPVLDIHTAKDNPVLVHPEEDWHCLVESCHADNKRNLCASLSSSRGDTESIMADCDIVLEETYHTPACQQSMMETFRTYTMMDAFGRLTIVSSTQVPFHVRRIAANALDIPKSRIRVIKPRIGGGFGAKQTAVSELYPAIVTLKTGRPAKILFTREESLIASSPRHEMEITAKIGAMKDGRIRAISIYSLSNTGAYGEHGPTTVPLTSEESISLYRPEAFSFRADVVYTNHMSAGAYRGYGATQGIFALESLVNRLAHTLGLDPVRLRMENMVHQGDILHSYFGLENTSCTLDKCLTKTADMIGWKEGHYRRIMPDGHIRAKGIAMAMQSSGIPFVDVGSVTLKLSDEGFYNLNVGCTDMGTGCDTILAQMAADCLQTSIDNIVVTGVDTDTSPYDSGSYASSTTYVTGMAVVQACQQMEENILKTAAMILQRPDWQALYFDGEKVTVPEDGREITLEDIATQSMRIAAPALTVSASHTSPTSPPPFMAGAAEIDLDPETGIVRVLSYDATVDCGTVINPALARVQTEGGIVQGLGMALTEDIWYDEKGRNYSNSFMQYKIPARTDVGDIHVEFAQSYEETGPFGAKSIGEVVVNTSAPAIAHAIYNACGVWFQELPITPEKILKGTHKI